MTSKQAKIIALEFLQSKPVIMYNNQRTKTEQIFIIITEYREINILRATHNDGKLEKTESFFFIFFLLSVLLGTQRKQTDLPHLIACT